MSIAGSIAQTFTSLKEMELADRGLANDILKRFLEAHPEVLGAWCVWEPNAFDGRDSAFAGQPGHDQSGRFVPLWHRYGGAIRLEPNTNYDKPDSGHWYLIPSRRAEEMVIDPYAYSMGGKPLFITTQVAPIFHKSRCVGAAGIDILLESLFPETSQRVSPGVSQLEASLQRGYVLIDREGEVRSCSGYAQTLLSRCAGLRLARNRRLPKPLRERFQAWSHDARPSLSSTEQASSAGEQTLSIRFSRNPLSDGAVLVLEMKKDGAKPVAMNANLSVRQLEVLSWLGCGKSNDEIGVILGTSAHTVKHHVEQILAKLGVENRYAAALAYREAVAQAPGEGGAPIKRRNSGVDAVGNGPGYLLPGTPVRDIVASPKPVVVSYR